MMPVIYILAALLILYFINKLNNSYIDTQIFTIRSSKIPDELCGKRVLLISDLHNNHFGKKNLKLKKKIYDIGADAVISAGDLFDRSHDNGYSKELCRWLSKRYDFYLIKGNHEENLKHSDPELYKTINTGVFSEELMDDESIGFHGAVLYGLNLPESNYKRFNAEPVSVDLITDALGAADKTAYNILTVHNPADCESFFEWGADLVLSGHLHGGFIRFFGRGIITPQLKFFPKYSGGMYKPHEDKYLVISRGLGATYSNLRIFNRPELIVLEFQNDNNNKCTGEG